MTKKDYVIIAKAIRFAKEKNQNLERLAVSLADALRADNQMFKKDVFMAECGFPKV